MNDFVHLHVHTQYSILDGASNIPKIIAKAKDNGMKAIAITDHGNMFGAKVFHKEAHKQGIKPILGCEVYVSKTTRFDKSDKIDRGGNHLILLAKNPVGYKNLIKLVSFAWMEGYYYNPRIDKELLHKYHEGIIATSACLGGEVPQAIMNHGADKALEVIKEFKEIFDDDFYLELQRHQSGDPETDADVFDRQQEVNKVILNLAQQLDVKCVATNDVHFINAEDAEAHDRLICLNTGKDLDDPDRMRYTKQEFFKTREEMNNLFEDHPEVLENTIEICDKIEDYELDREPIMPDYPLPEEFTDENEYLRHLTYEGAKKRYGEITENITERLDYELGVIKKMGFPGYFLIVQDFLNEARKMGVAVGPGRGSAAGSAVAYCTKITDIDPIKYNLLFERFLNPDRISMPDIDIDFDEDGREKVLKWVVEKYGKNRVAQIITFGTMAAKMAIRDVARVQKLPLSDADYLAKLVPERPGTTLESAYKEVSELRDARKSDNKLIAETLKYAETLEGSVRQTGLHACGIIIGRDDLFEHIPISTSKETDLLVAQYDGKNIEDVGMLKMDFLGLKTLSIIKDAIENIKLSKGIDIDIDTIPLDDEKTYELYANGETTALFQFESPGMKKHLRALKPNRFEDLIAMNALYRPGPMEYIPSFINRKHGIEKIEYDLPEMEEHLKESYGITVYQEQVMLLSQKLAGFSGGQADSLRKAMGKKIKKLMAELQVKFVEGCAKNGHKEETVLKIWTDWESFAEYAFNKSHSTCYSLVSYQTAWLKAHYPAEFMAAVLSRNLTDIKKITTFMDECNRMKLKVLGPDVNESHLKFNVGKGRNVRFGLAAIKGVGEAAALSIIDERTKNGPYEDIFDFVSRVNLHSVNKKNIEALAQSGAFDCFPEIDRYQFFLENGNSSSFSETLIRFGNLVQAENNSQQQTLFGNSDDFQVTKPPIPDGPPWGKLEKLKKEKELIGIYLSAHPLDDFKVEIDHFCNTTMDELQNLAELKGRKVICAGIVTAVREATTKTGRPFGTITLQDYSDSYRLTLFGQDYLDMKKFFTEGYSLYLKGTVQNRQYGNTDEMELKIESMEMLADLKDKIKGLTIQLPLDEVSETLIHEFVELASNNKGKATLQFEILDVESNIRFNMFSRKFMIKLNSKVLNYLIEETSYNFKLS
ncbi:MAG: DNA polymerase III subunit alpha [Bacteroidales bacterium]|nr:DNA polymerase III subunit alpha [Bacteroidales bacterium]MCF8457189.1 DNA polymerase III subunit alpha [Bacteroidales bacterium]